MQYTTLGRTGIEVSVAGLGAGGPSRLGQSGGESEQHSIEVVRAALDEGITLIDSSELYGTEEIVGKAIAGRRDGVVLSTKAYWRRDTPAERSARSRREGDERLASPAELTQSLEGSLTRLGTDHVDVYLLHAVTPEVYEQVETELAPALERLREHGQIRAIGVTEAFIRDPGHKMLERAVRTGPWDVVMCGFNILNQSARDRVFPVTQERGIGTLCMFAVRRALSRPEHLRQTVAELRDGGHLNDGDVDPDDPLGFLVHPGGASSVVDAAYRFCRHESGIDVVLTGTGSIGHLQDNVRSILAPPLPEEDTVRLRRLFAGVDHVSGN